MTPKKEKCGLGAAAPKNPAQECTSCTFLGFEFAVQTRTIVLGGRPVRLRLRGLPYAVSPAYLMQ